MPDEDLPNFLNVRQVAKYLQLNEKKVYTLLGEGRIPATRMTGKWMFPRHLVDQWMIESSHGGVLTDRLTIVGAGDVLLQRVVNQVTRDIQHNALLSYNATGTRLGLALLAQHRADICAIHWGPAAESERRHPALIRHFPQHHQWVIVRLVRREQGLMLASHVDAGDDSIETLLKRDLRWVLRQDGSGSYRFLQECLTDSGIEVENLKCNYRALSEREAASVIANEQADIGPGARSSAGEFDLQFRTAGWEAVDLVMYKDVYFRTFFRELVNKLESTESAALAAELGGYEIRDVGKLVWSD